MSLLLENILKFNESGSKVYWRTRSSEKCNQIVGSLIGETFQKQKVELYG